MLERRVATLVVMATLASLGCSGEGTTVARPEPSIEVGGIYATQDKDGSWRLMRVLALDEDAVHLRSYADRFPEPPRDVDLAKLEWHVGHMPLARAGFLKQHRVLVKVVPVDDEELEGYRLYLEAMEGGR
jgi:hypothetical protein